jgi:peptidoglycan hydrolase-like protein with peptidoglycan-binding domain
MDRFTEAATVPFRSLNMGRTNTPEESIAVSRLQNQLTLLEKNSFLLPTRLLARRTPFSPPSGYGPFVFGQETVLGGNPKFGRLTDIAVRTFQAQADLDVDGKAGINTLGKLSERVSAIGAAQGQSSAVASQDDVGEDEESDT